MKRKLPTFLILLVMVLLGAMYWVDICYNTDPVTGFLQHSGLWKRYAVLLVPLVMVLLGLGTVGAQGVGVLRARSRGLAALFVAAAAVGVACGVTQVVMSIAQFSVYRMIMGVLFAWYGVWMFLVALQMLVQSAPTPTSGAFLGVLAALPFCVLTVYRVMMKPTSLYRLGPLVATLAGLLAVLWFGTLLRGLYVALPLSRLRWMYFLGLFTFLFGTCLALPQAVFSAMFEGVDPLEMMESIIIATLGLVAGSISVCATGTTTDALEAPDTNNTLPAAGGEAE